MVSVRLVLKIYSLFLGCVVSFMSFMWVAFELYVVSQTPPDQVTMLTPTLYKTWPLKILLNSYPPFHLCVVTV